jgi:hypothetical protein
MTADALQGGREKGLKLEALKATLVRYLRP